MQSASTDTMVQQGAQANEGMLSRIREALRETRLLDNTKNTPLTTVIVAKAREAEARLDQINPCASLWIYP